MSKISITRAERRQQIRKLIGEQEITDQSQLVAELKKRGIRVTQATVSRDLQELNVAKVLGGQGVHKYAILEGPPPVSEAQLVGVMHSFVLEFKNSGNLLLIKTSSGNANTVAAVIDRCRFREILGTIAGDDTVLVVCPSVSLRRAVAARFRQLLEMA